MDPNRDEAEMLRREIAAVYAERREVANYTESKRASASAARHTTSQSFESALRRAQDVVEQRLTEALRQHAESGVLPPSEQDLVELNELRLESERRVVSRWRTCARQLTHAKPASCLVCYACSQPSGAGAGRRAGDDIARVNGPHSQRAVKNC